MVQGTFLKFFHCFHSKTFLTIYFHHTIVWITIGLKKKVKDKRFYTKTWLLCAFSLVVDRDDVKSTPYHPQNPSIHPLNFYCIKQIDNIFSVCVYWNRSQKTSQRVKNNSHTTRLRLVTYFLVLYTLWRHLWSTTVHTHGKMLSIC